MKIKMDDLARKLDLSVAAVSMALNNKKGVSEETRERVMRAAEEMGYKRKAASKPIEDVTQKKYLQLIRLKKHGLVAADTAFFSEVVDGIDEAAKKAGYQLLISNLYINDIKQNSFVSEDYDHADGVIVFATELDSEDVSFLHDLKKRIVILDSYFVDQGWDTILMNNYEAAFQAIQYFYKKGHRRIGYLRSNTPIYNFQKRYLGYMESMELMDLAIIDSDTLLLEPTIAGAQRDMEQLLVDIKPDQLPTAFLADNDIIAAGAINAMKNKGIRIPQDVSVIGIDDMPFCQITDPKLTTIRIFKNQIGREAVALLLRSMRKDGNYSQKIEINTELIERESVETILD